MAGQFECGCADQEEALANMQDAIREYLAGLEDRFPGAEVREVEVKG